MNASNSNCCNTGNSDCTTENTTCCSTEQKSPGKNKGNNYPKKMGLGILLIAITFAVLSAFNSSQSAKSSNCSSEDTSCATTCDTDNSEGSSCCSKK